MSREFVDAIVAGNNIEAEKVFTQSIATKVGDNLEVKFEKTGFKKIKARFVERKV